MLVPCRQPLLASWRRLSWSPPGSYCSVLVMVGLWLHEYLTNQPVRHSADLGIVTGA